MATRTIAQTLTIASKEIGTHGLPIGSHKVKYNKWFYGRDVSGSAYPWCAVFVSWVFANTGIIKATASCGVMMANMKANWVKTPQAGDIVFFDWNANGIPDHVGIVEKVLSNKQIQTIEGNTSSGSNANGDYVQRRIRSIVPWCLKFARPAYSVVTQPKATPVPKKPTQPAKKAMPQIKRGSKGDAVKTWQKIVGVKADGIFGTVTEKYTRAWQKARGLYPDGIVGVKTWASAGYK